LQSDSKQNSTSIMTPRIVAVAGGKGGIGKTVMSVMISLELAKCGYDVTLIDADLGGANLASIFGISNLQTTLKDFLIGNITELNELVHPSGITNLNFIPGTVGDYGLANIKYEIKQKFIRKIPHIQSDWIILDLGAGTFFDQLDFFNAAQTGIIITTPDPMAIQDSFNFIKLSLFRKIFNTFHPIKELRKIVEQFLYSHRNDELDIFNQVQKNIFEVNDQYLPEWKDIISSFKPILLLNRLTDEEDYKEGVALRIALKEMLGISMQGYTTVRYDKAVHSLCADCDPQQFLNLNSSAAQDVSLFVHQFLLGKKVENKKSEQVEPAINHHEHEELICSVNCELWGNCSMEMGGYPCRIPALGYINQKK